MQNKLNVLLFDASPLIYIAYYGAIYALKNQTDEDKLKTIAHNILIDRIQSCFNNFTNQDILPIFCYDGFPKKKMEMLSSYKSNRTHTISKDLRKYLKDTIKLFPGYHVINKEEEADDLIATMKERLKYKIKNCNFIIFSKDNDLMQLCDYRTILIDPSTNGKIKDRKYLSEKFNGLTNFKHIILHKICFGDSSDNIEGLFKRKKRKPYIEEIKKCKKLSDFLNLSFIVFNNFIERASNLFYLIQLKTNLDFELFIQKQDNILSNSVNIKLEDF